VWYGIVGNGYAGCEGGQVTTKWRNRLKDTEVLVALVLFIVLVMGMVNCVMERMG
jgi:hypothetical protein